MPDPLNYIHGVSSDEQQRLKLLNDLTNQSFIHFLNLQSHEIALELGSGLGLLCASVATKLFRGKTFGVELSKEQLRQVPQFPPNLEFILGDVHDLPFDDNIFDLVYGRYILEHVSDPMKVLKEAYRVLKPEGKICIQENSVLWMEFYPACPHFIYAWKKFAQLQSMMGGDAMIGIKLFERMKKTGFKKLKISIAPEIHSFDDTSFNPWITNLIGNLNSAKIQLLEKSFLSITEFNAAIEELTEFMANTFASTYFAWNRIEAFK
ncbi:MAG: methyltransferase domain-containing protein [Saprospiraceae bacterium]